MPLADKCSFEGCDRPRRYAELCMGHYKQYERGKPLSPLRKRHRRTAPIANLKEWRKLSTMAVSHVLIDGMWLPTLAAMERD